MDAMVGFWEDVDYGRTFLPIYAVALFQNNDSVPLIPPIAFWEEPGKRLPLF